MPKEAVGKLAPLRTLQRQPLNYTRVKRCEGRGDYDSDTMSEESFESELSPRERRLHQSALVSHYDKVHESTSSEDDEKLEHEAEVYPGRSQLDNLSGPLQTEHGKSGGDAESDTFDKQDFRRLNSKKCDIGRLREVPRAFWPSWVYHMYDSYCLAQKAAGTCLCFKKN